MYAPHTVTVYNVVREPDPATLKDVTNLYVTVLDGVFCEAHLILCRNVLIYFSNPLQNQVLGLFREGLKAPTQ